MARIFISYAMEDAKEAAEFHRLLTLLGFTCFLAHKDIRKGEQWREAILRSIRDADVFIPLLSDHGVTSAWVQQECGMAHVLAEGRKRKPIIIPVVPNGKTPPGCLSEYQAQLVRVTFWTSKLSLDSAVVTTLGSTIAGQTASLPEIRPRTISNLKGAAVADICVVLEFLRLVGQLAFNEFLTVIKYTSEHPTAYRSDPVMTHVYALMRDHYEEVQKHPDWLAACNRLHERYQQFKEEERRRQEEFLRKLTEQSETTDKPAEGDERKR